MSNWTHVCAAIRIDDLRLDKHLPDFDELIGKECLFESPYEVWDDFEAHPEKYLPMGSEGTLQKSVWVNPNLNTFAAYTVTIFGDLRDHHDPKKIVKWFKNLCDEIGSVRNAVITVENEINGTVTYAYKE